MFHFKKREGNSIFKLPKAKNEFFEKWRDQLVQVMTRNRVIDPDLRGRLAEDILHICENHFQADCFYTCKYLTVILHE